MEGKRWKDQNLRLVILGIFYINGGKLRLNLAQNKGTNIFEFISELHSLLYNRILKLPSIPQPKNKIF